MRNTILLIMLVSNVALANVTEYLVTSGNVDARFTTEQVITMLKQGRTCIKDGVRVLAKSKDITKKHCQKSRILGLRVVKAKQLPVAMYTQLTGLK
jgi:hypothetical protein